MIAVTDRNPFASGDGLTDGAIIINASNLGQSPAFGQIYFVNIKVAGRQFNIRGGGNAAVGLKR